MLYLLLGAVIFPIQTIVVFSDTASGGGDDWLYWVFNAIILDAGIELNQLGATLKERRRSRARPLPTAAHPPSGR